MSRPTRNRLCVLYRSAGVTKSAMVVNRYSLTGDREMALLRISGSSRCAAAYKAAANRTADACRSSDVTSGVVTSVPLLTAGTSLSASGAA